MDWTQHMFKFEKCDIGERYPLGVKTSYRKYAQDVCKEIRPVPKVDGGEELADGEVPYKIWEFTSTWFEVPSVLKQAPVGEIDPEAFLHGSRAAFVKVNTSVSSYTITS